MKINNSTDFDLDLFFRNNIYLMHFATAGLQVKDEIFFDTSHNDFRNFIKNFSPPRFKHQLNPALDDIISVKRENNKDFNAKLYTADFINYAEMGIFSFDRTFIERTDDTNFHLVAYPILDENYNHLFNQVFNHDLDIIDYHFINVEVDQLVKSYFSRSYRPTF